MNPNSGLRHSNIDLYPGNFHELSSAYNLQQPPDSGMWLHPSPGDLGLTGHPEAMSLRRASAEVERQSRDLFQWRALQFSKSKLKAITGISGLLSGFAMVAMIELQVDKEIPQALLVAYFVTVTLLVAVHILALMISTCILPYLGSYSSADMRNVRESPHDNLRRYIEMAWIFSTGMGMVLFLCAMVLACWVKLYQISRVAAVVCTVIISPTMLVFIGFAVLFYTRLVNQKMARHEGNLGDLLKVIDESSMGHGGNSGANTPRKFPMASRTSPGLRDAEEGRGGAPDGADDNLFRFSSSSQFNHGPV